MIIRRKNKKLNNKNNMKLRKQENKHIQQSHKNNTQ